MWLAACFDYSHAVKLDRSQELTAQSGFSDSCLARNHYRLRDAGLRIGERASNLAELKFAADVFG
jgi:hypothetical protein